MTKHKKRIIPIILIVLVLLAGVGTYIYFFQGLTPHRILNNISIAGTNVGGMTKEEAVAAVTQRFNDTYGSTSMDISVEPYSVSIAPETAGAVLDVEGAVQEAYNYGREGVFAQRKAQQLAVATAGCDVDISQYLTLDTPAIRNALLEFSKKFDTILTQSSISLLGDSPNLLAPAEEIVPQKLIITKGTSLYALDLEGLIARVLKAYYDMQFSVQYSCTVTPPDSLDLQEIYDQYYIGAVDAVLNPDTFQITREVCGYDFDLQQAQEAIQRLPEGGSMEVSFRVIQPENTYDSLYNELFKDVLATFTAESSSQYGRDTNLRLACEAINGLILYPGDVFSYNPTLGERTPERGYMPAASYIGMQTVNTYGGGICQVSSCVYYCAVVADLEIVQRHNHTFNTGYVPVGTDATVDWSGPNLRFKNNSDHPIRIDAYAEGGKTVVTFMGTDNKDYYVKFENEITDVFPYQTSEATYPPDNEEGYVDGQVIITPYTGYRATTYRAKYDKQTDELISRDLEAYSAYSSRDEVICRIVDPED